MNEYEELRGRLDAARDLPPPTPPTSHELAKKLLALPDRPITVVKGEGGGYVSEWRLHPGDPWLDLTSVRVQIEKKEASASNSLAQKR